MFVTQGEAFSGLSDCHKELLASILPQDESTCLKSFCSLFISWIYMALNLFGVVNWKQLET